MPRIIVMRIVSVLLLAVILSILDHAQPVMGSAAPHWALALAGWIAAAGTVDRVLVRVWLVGLVIDLVDPGSTIHHAIGLTLLFVAAAPLQKVFKRSSPLTAGVWAALFVVGLSIMDLFVGRLPLSALPQVALEGLSTGLAGVVVSALGKGLPESVRPVVPADRQVVELGRPNLRSSLR